MAHDFPLPWLRQSGVRSSPYQFRVVGSGQGPQPDLKVGTQHPPNKVLISRLLENLWGNVLREMFWGLHYQCCLAGKWWNLWPLTGVKALYLQVFALGRISPSPPWALQVGLSSGKYLQTVTASQALRAPHDFLSLTLFSDSPATSRFLVAYHASDLCCAFEQNSDLSEMFWQMVNVLTHVGSHLMELSG